MTDKELIINAMVLSIQNDIKRGYKKEDLLNHLSGIMGKDIINSVKQRL